MEIPSLGRVFIVGLGGFVGAAARFVLGVGVQRLSGGEEFPFGTLFVGAPFQFLPFAVIPDSRDFVVPDDAPVGMELAIQELAIDFFTGNGNFSNAVQLTIEEGTP